MTDIIIANWLEESDHNSDDNFSGDDSEIEDHVSDEDAQDDVEEGYIKYCSYCTSKKKRMSKMTCAKCQKSICGEHQVHVCIECI